MKWLLTSDWQAKFATLDACKRAHEQELEIISKHDIEGHIDLGDLKDDFNPVDVNVVSFQQQRKEAIHNAVTHDITLLGNHDMLGQYAADKNWFSLFDSISGNNIKTPQLLTLGNVSFSCLPFRRSNNELIKHAEMLRRKQDKLQDGKSLHRQVLLFHCDVRDSRYNNVNSRKSTAKVTTANLFTDKYDFCFGGHIHLHQYLNKNTMYVGNPFCADAGEIDQKKGFIIYDDVTNTCTRLLSKVPGIFSWKYVQANKPKLVAGTRIKATVECSPSDSYHKVLDGLANKIEKQYPDCVAYVVPTFADTAEGTTDYVEVDPESSDFDKIKAYVSATVPLELKHKRKALMQYLPSILANASSTGVRQSGKIIFEKAHVENVLTLGDVSFSFRNRGVVLVKGENKDSWMASNGAGKTNFLSMIPIALFGRTFKNQKNDEWANDSNSSRAKATLQMTDDAGRKLTVIRGRRPVKLKFLIGTSDESKGRRHVGKKETQGLIEETIGYTFDTLANSVYLDQSLQNAFLTGTDKDRALLIHQFQNMDRFKVARDNIAKELSLVRKEESVLETEERIAESLLEETAKNISAAKKRSQENLATLRQEKRTALDNFRSLRRALKQLEHVQGVRAAKLEKEAKTLHEKLDVINKALTGFETKLDLKKEERKTFEELGDAKKCPTCFQDLTEANKKILIARFTKAIGAINTDIKKNTVIRTKIETEINAIEEPLSKLKDEIESTERLVLRAEDKHEDAKQALIKAKLNASKKIDIKDHLSLQLKLTKNIARIKRALGHHEDDHKFLQYAQEAMSRDGLPAFLNKMLVPLLNKAASRYSEIFVDKEIQVLFNIVDGQIQPSVVNAHGAKSIKGQSTGEKAWAGLICSFALREIAQPTNLLILDEPGNGLDVESAKMFGERLSKLKKRFETIMVVSHNPAIVSALDGDNSVTVIKKHNISTLK